MSEQSFPSSISVRRDTFYFTFHYIPSILILSASCVVKKIGWARKMELTGDDECRGERGDRNSMEHGLLPRTEEQGTEGW